MDMVCLDLTLPTPEENLALDEVLLDLREGGETPDCLRFWESPAPFVAVGYSNRLSTEVLQDACNADGVPVLRRVSGGGTVLQGPGCLNYALALGVEGRPELKSLTRATSFIMERHRDALSALLDGVVQVEGISDLTWNGLKFSGNAQRRRRNSILFHGTFLHAFDLNLVERYLPLPTRRPEYRRDKPHGQFICNAPLRSKEIKEALRRAWNAGRPFGALPSDQVRALVESRYTQRTWNEKF